MFRRSRAAIVLALLFTAASFGGPAPTNAYHTAISCEGYGTTPHWVGDFELPAIGNAVGVESMIDISGEQAAGNPPQPDDSWFGPCIPWFNEFYDAGSFAYVGLMDTDNNRHFVTLGVTRCYNISDPCNGFGGTIFPLRPTPRLFWGVGECDGDLRLHDLGGAGYGNHTFRIVKDYNPNRFKFRIDDVTVDSIQWSDDRIDCWATDDKKAWLSGEVVDMGDSIGKDGGGGVNDVLKTKFAQMEVKPGQSDAFEPYTPNCQWVNPPVGQDVHPLMCNSGNTWMNVWSLED